MPAHSPAVGRPLSRLTLGLVSLPLVLGVTAALPASADAASSGPARPGVRLALENPSFAQGTGHWRAPGAADHLTALSRGHHDRHSVALRTTRAGRPSRAVLRQRVPAPTGVERGWVRSSAWVWSSSPRRVSLSVTAGRPGHARGLVHHVFRVGGRGWQQLSFVGWARIPMGVDLNVKLVVPALPSSSQLVVDDVVVRLTPAASSTPAQAGQAGQVTWASGASGDGVADGSFGRWRGRAVQIAGTWNDDPEAQKNQWSVLPGAEFGSWSHDLDVAVGGIYEDQGETWAAAARGAYDARWRHTLQTLARSWAGRPGTLYVRFAHEFNGDWERWRVTGADATSFKAAWRRFRALQQQVFPASKLVFCPNAETSASLRLDWRRAFPGADQVDVMSVDFYNQYPYLGSSRSFRSGLAARDRVGAPRGLDAHRRYAASVGAAVRDLGVVHERRDGRRCGVRRRLPPVAGPARRARTRSGSLRHRVQREQLPPVPDLSPHPSATGRRHLPPAVLRTAVRSRRWGHHHRDGMRAVPGAMSPWAPMRARQARSPYDVPGMGSSRARKRGSGRCLPPSCPDDPEDPGPSPSS